ncbi:unnamed protein product [Owenia fusiformis]|uniref:EGF-like domain-containing protein n=1 Tax=Owenia fusiformis TaxID=6347 RepID=A0A8S4NVI2_OWEFU|nr:unnamed protein product [Owenia fusiformis]
MKEVELALWDTAGQEDYDRLRPLSYPDTDVILMCFSIDSPDSLENIPEKWTPEVKHFCPKVPIILVGNKKDLRNDENTKRELMKMKQEPVRPEDARVMSDKIDAFAYLECSAKTKDGVREVFETATRAALQHWNERTVVENEIVNEIDDFSILTPLDAVCPDDCSGNGDCVSDKCICHQGWLRDNCDTPDCSSLNDCNDHGQCTSPNFCKCRTGWGGKSCHINLCSKAQGECGKCIQDDRCGWSDQPSPECLPGDYQGPDSALVAGSWFYWNCLTVSESTRCSSEIGVVSCTEACDRSAENHLEKDCLQCLDFKNCYQIESNYTCKIWDNTKCPGGIPVPDYTNPDRIQFTDIKEDVRVIAKEEATVFFCPTKISSNDVTSKDTRTDIFITHSDLSDKLQSGHVVASAQAGGILHRVENVTTLDGFTLFLGKYVSLDSVVLFTDFETQVDLEAVDDEVTVEDEPVPDLVEDLLSGNLTLANSPNLKQMKENNIFKCVGRVFEAPGVTDSDLYSVFLVIRINEVSNTYTIGEVVIGTDNSTQGYIEIVERITPITDATLVETRLVDCSIDKDKITEIVSNTKTDEASRQSGKRMVCPGGDNWPTMHYFDSSLDTSSVTKGAHIVGRASGAFLLQVVDVSELNGYVFIEGLPVTEEIENNTYVPKNITAIARKKRATFSKTFSPSWRFGTPFTKDLGGGLTLTFSPTLMFRPSVTFSAEIGVWYPFFHRIGATFRGQLTAGLKVTATFEKEWEKPWEKTLIDRTIGRFVIPLFGVPIPGKIYFKLVFKLVAWAEFKASVTGSVSASALATAGGTWTYKNGLTIHRPTFTPTFTKDFGERYIKKRLRLDKLRWILPKSLEDALLGPEGEITYKKYRNTNIVGHNDRWIKTNNKANEVPFTLDQCKASCTASDDCKSFECWKSGSGCWRCSFSLDTPKTATSDVKPLNLADLYVKEDPEDDFEAPIDLSIEAPLIAEVKAELCAENCVNEPEKELGISFKAGLQRIKAELDLDVIVFARKFPILDLETPNLMFYKTLCIPLDIPGISCCKCNETGEDGVLHAKTKECLCKCTCPDGTPSVKKQGGECLCKKCPDGKPERLKGDGSGWCPCPCLDGKLRDKMKPDGTCDCSCPCEDGKTMDIWDEDGNCPCNCTCKDCSISTLGPDGCECYDRCPCGHNDKGVWINCECFLKKTGCGVPEALCQGADCLVCHRDVECCSDDECRRESSDDCFVCKNYVCVKPDLPLACKVDSDCCGERPYCCHGICSECSSDSHCSGTNRDKCVKGDVGYWVCGDPHFDVQLNNGLDSHFCFDIAGNSGAIYQLVHDTNIDIRMKIFSPNKRYRGRWAKEIAIGTNNVRIVIDKNGIHNGTTMYKWGPLQHIAIEEPSQMNLLVRENYAEIVVAKIVIEIEIKRGKIPNLKFSIHQQGGLGIGVHGILGDVANQAEVIPANSHSKHGNIKLFGSRFPIEEKVRKISAGKCWFLKGQHGQFDKKLKQYIKKTLF